MTGSEWLEKNKENIIECKLRHARFHKRHCYYLQHKVPDKGIDEMGTFNDGLGRAMNICRGCENFKSQLEVKKYLKERKTDEKDQIAKESIARRFLGNTYRRRKSQHLQPKRDDG